ncbi:hypothetical protein [Candidatus Phytoplasma meliae]|uniref:Uncharacterized protein n=1 Tax=Candidatus Phytoplasma meliae TaxID=1848402 RepID=A0ABS5CYJ9_9MOLU|nr:hypothetical protein [Candidatus Phytoplasma meliae]MBP5836057.1 hypothetical protein [Candidatus Phytoplasma meliae]
MESKHEIGTDVFLILAVILAVFLFFCKKTTKEVEAESEELEIMYNKRI